MPKMFSLIAFSVILFSFFPNLDAQSTDRTKDARAIGAVASAYQNAFNQGDAKTLALMWAEDGEYVDQTGFLMRGREVIAKAFNDFFNQNKGVKLEINIEAIKFLADDVISEIGTTKSTSADGKSVVEARYSIIHKKPNGNWLMLSVHEQPPYPPSNYEKLKGLEWLVGNWVDEPTGSKDTPVIQIASYWSVNRNFIIREFTASMNGRISNVGTQRIGWHAPSNQIRSWAFDSKGGIITGAWSQSGENWTVASTETLPGGQVVTATETVKQNNDASQTWSITGRASGGKSLPDKTFKLVPMRN